jgi:hypothetical protein
VTRTNKDFVVKNGLIVEGAQGTINGEVIVTEESLGTSLGDYIEISEKGNPDGVATLDENGQVPAEQLGNAGGGADFTITDALLGDTLYVGSTEPSDPAEGDIWIDESSVTGASITWGQLKELGGIVSGS